MERNAFEKDIMKCNEEVIAKLNEVVEIIKCEHGKLLRELQFIEKTLKTDRTRNTKGSKTMENAYDENDRHAQERNPTQHFNTDTCKAVMVNQLPNTKLWE